MKGYSTYGVKEFIICAGYKQHVIKEWFVDYFLHDSDITFDLNNIIRLLFMISTLRNGKVTVVDTGLNTITGGRVKRIRKYVGDEPFYLTYGDAVSDVNIDKLTEFHNSHGKCVMHTSISLAHQKGMLDVDNNTITAFREKEDEDGAVVNGGFKVCNSGIFDYLQDDKTVLKQVPMRKLAVDGELNSFYHKGFWQYMDTKGEKDKLESLWASGKSTMEDVGGLNEFDLSFY